MTALEKLREVNSMIANAFYVLKSDRGYKLAFDPYVRVYHTGLKKSLICKSLCQEDNGVYIVTPSRDKYDVYGLGLKSRAMLADLYIANKIKNKC